MFVYLFCVLFLQDFSVLTLFFVTSWYVISLSLFIEVSPLLTFWIYLLLLSINLTL